MCRDVRDAKDMEGLLRKAEDGASPRERSCEPHTGILGVGGAAVVSDVGHRAVDVSLGLIVSC